MAIERTIEYMAAKNAFAIKVPPWEVNRCRMIPNRRWSKPLGAWLAPALRRNVEYLKAQFKNATWTPEALQAVIDIERRMTIARRPFPASYPFKYSPYRHQSRAYDHFFGLHCFAFFAGMGTGKTKVSIDLANAWADFNEIDQVCIACPPSVTLTWQQDLAKHSARPYDLHILSPQKFERSVKWHKEPHAAMPWLVVPVSALSASQRSIALVGAFISSGRTLFLTDESITIKNSDSNRTKEAIGLARLKGAVKRGILNGTPVSKGLEDLYSQFQFLDPDIIGIGDYYSFRNRYCVMGGYEQKEIIGYTNVDELFELIRPYTLEVSKEEALPDLPPKVYQVRTYTPSDEQKALLKDVDLLRKAWVNGEEVSVSNILAVSVKSQQILSGFVFGDDHKILNITDMPPKYVEMMAALEQIGKDKAIIWTRFIPETQRVLALLRKTHGDEAVEYLHPGTSEEDRAKRERAVTNFRGAAQFLVGNAVVGGMGLDLWCANYEIFMTSPVAYVDRSQAEDRPHRIGQTKTVFVIDIVGVDTVEEDILTANKNHLDLVEYVKSRMRIAGLPRT